MKRLKSKRYTLNFWRSYPGFSFKKYKAVMHEQREWELCLGYFVLRKQIHPAIIESWPPWSIKIPIIVEAMRAMSTLGLSSSEIEKSLRNKLAEIARVPDAKD